MIPFVMRLSLKCLRVKFAQRISHSPPPHSLTRPASGRIDSFYCSLHVYKYIIDVCQSFRFVAIEVCNPNPRGDNALLSARMHGRTDRRNHVISDFFFQIQSTPVISKSKGLSEILRDIRISTYQICRIEEKR